MIPHARRILQSAIVICLTAANVWAQEPARLPGDDNSVMQWLAMALVAGLILTPAFKNAKRSHQT